MQELKKPDKIAYIRFAGGYRSFEDIDEFKRLVDVHGGRHALTGKPTGGQPVATSGLVNLVTFN